MRTQLNPKWVENRRAEMDAYKEAVRNSQVPPPIDVTTSHNQAIQWLIASLANREIPFKLIQLGAGVKRVTTLTDVCPKCNGTGRC